MFYLIIFIVLICFALLEVNGFSEKRLRSVHVFCGVMLFLIAGLRYETGVDWRAYGYYFDEIAAFQDAFNSDDFSKIFITLDVGYSLLNSIVKMIGGGIQSVFLIMSLLTSTLLIKNLRYYSKYVLTGLVIYYCFFFFIFDLSGIRQGLSIQIVLFSLKFISQKRFFKYLLFILLATSVHWTSLLFLPLYFLLDRNASRKMTYILFIVSIIIFTFQIKWLGLILGDLMLKLNMFTLLSGKIDAYMTNETLSVARGWDMYSVYNFLRLFIVVILANKYLVILSSKIKHFNIIYNMILLEIFCFFCLYEFTEVSERLRFYFAISEIILGANIIYCFRFYFYRHLSFMLTLIIIFLNSYPYLLQSPSTVAYYPYQNYLIYTILDKKSDGDARLEKHILLH